MISKYLLNAWPKIGKKMNRIIYIYSKYINTLYYIIFLKRTRTREGFRYKRVFTHLLCARKKIWGLRHV